MQRLLDAMKATRRRPYARPSYGVCDLKEVPGSKIVTDANSLSLAGPHSDQQSVPVGLLYSQ